MSINLQKFLGKKPIDSPLPGKGNPKITFNNSSVASSADNISQYSGEKISDDAVQNLSIINIKLIDVNNFLKDSLVLDKVKAGIAKRKKEKILRNQKEDKDETSDDEDDPQKGKKKFSLPGANFLKKVNNWIVKLIFGFLVVKLYDWLPNLTGILPKIGKALDWVWKWGERIVGALATVVHWGYKAYDWTRGKVEDVFGKKGVKVFDTVMDKLAFVAKLVSAVAIAAAAMSVSIAMANYKKGAATIVSGGKTAAAGGIGSKIMTALGFGKGAAATTGATQLTIPGLGVGGAGGTTAGGTAATAGGIGTAATVGIVAGAGLLASGLGEGIFQIGKKGKEVEDDLFKRYQKRKWYLPQDWLPKAGLWASLQWTKFQNYLMGTVGVILDIVGTPFRYLIELIRYPFLDEKGKAKQRENLAKFDARIREQFRKMVNAFSLGLLAKEEGAFGDIYGGEGVEAMGYVDPKTRKHSKEQKEPLKDVSNLSSEQRREGFESLFGGNNRKKVDRKVDSLSSFASYDDPSIQTYLIPVNNSPQPIPVGGSEGGVPFSSSSSGGGGNEIGEYTYIR